MSLPPPPPAGRTIEKARFSGIGSLGARGILDRGISGGVARASGVDLHDRSADGHPVRSMTTKLLPTFRLILERASMMI